MIFINFLLKKIIVLKVSPIPIPIIQVLLLFVTSIAPNYSPLAEGECDLCTAPRSSFIETHWFWRTSPALLKQCQPISMNNQELGLPNLENGSTGFLFEKSSSYTPKKLLTRDSNHEQHSSIRSFFHYTTIISYNKDINLYFKHYLMIFFSFKL